MDAIITPGKLSGTFTAPPSKSHSHRLLIAARLSGDPLCADVPILSEDIAATADCLDVLCAAFPEAFFAPRDAQTAQDAQTLQTARLAPPARSVPTSATQAPAGRNITLDCRESGSTLRFLLPIAAALANAGGSKRHGLRRRKLRFARSGRLPERPLSPLKEEMQRHGVSMKELKDGTLVVSGCLRGGEYEIDGSVSSQFITGLLFALPLTDEGGSIRVTGTLASRPYVDMTLKVLRQFGIKVTEQELAADTEAAGASGGFFTALAEEKGTLFTIPGKQRYTAPLLPARPEGDWSNSAFFLAANALCGHVEAEGLTVNSPQGDKIILDILTACAKYRQSPMPSELVIDAEDIPDLVPILAVLARGTGTPMQIIGAGRLRTKESDRLATVKALMESLRCPCEIMEDGLLIKPAAEAGSADKPAGAEADASGSANTPDDAEACSTGRGDCATLIDGCNDHRIVMAAAIAATVCPGPVRITGCEAVNKSWPGFFDTFAALGGKVTFCE